MMWNLPSNPLRRIPARLVVGVMIFMAGMFAYMLTFNFSISLLAMVEPFERLAIDDGTVDEALDLRFPDYGPRYSWSAYEQSLVVGAYFYGNVLSSLPGGLLLERFGLAKVAILWSFVLCTTLGLLSPLAAGWSFAAMFVVRFAMGLLQGILNPGYTCLISKWAPPQEMGFFTVAIMGANMGTVLTWSLSGVIVERYGWQATFYITGAIAAVFTVSWIWLVYDAPAVHPRIRPAERDYIEQSMHDVTKMGERRSWPPLWAMATSVPFWALFVVHFGNNWGQTFVLTAVPKFLNEVLGFDIADTGFLASVPYLLRTLVALLFGYVSRALQARFPRVSLTVWRKVFSVFSHIVPGLLLMLIPMMADQPYVCIALMSLSFGFNGAVTVVSISNCHDLSPNYATTLNSIVNGLGNSAGFLSPLVVAYFTQEKNTIDEWRSILYVGAATYILSAIVFVIGGSGLVQEWNEPKKKAPRSTTAQINQSNSIQSVD